MFFWLDCFVSVFSTIWFGVSWFIYTNHSLTELADDPEKMAEHDRIFKMESQVSIAVLVVLRLIHVSYYHMIERERDLRSFFFSFLVLLCYGGYSLL